MTENAVDVWNLLTKTTCSCKRKYYYNSTNSFFSWHPRQLKNLLVILSDPWIILILMFCICTKNIYPMPQIIFDLTRPLAVASKCLSKRKYEDFLLRLKFNLHPALKFGFLLDFHPWLIHFALVDWLVVRFIYLFIYFTCLVLLVVATVSPNLLTLFYPFPLFILFTIVGSHPLLGLVVVPYAHLIPRAISFSGKIVTRFLEMIFCRKKRNKITMYPQY